MKTLILILLAIFLIGCEAEQSEQSTCDCYKETWVRYGQNEWYKNGSSNFYSNDCDDDGREVGQPYSGQGYDVKYIVDCQ